MTLEADHRTLPIQTIYRLGKQVAKVNRAGSGTSAVPLCVTHMRANDYEADTAEVLNNENGKLHAVVHRSVQGRITILFQRPYKEGE